MTSTTPGDSGTITVPSGITQAVVEGLGPGGDSDNSCAGGGGGDFRKTLSVQANDTIYWQVGVSGVSASLIKLNGTLIASSPGGKDGSVGGAGGIPTGNPPITIHTGGAGCVGGGGGGGATVIANGHDGTATQGGNFGGGDPNTNNAVYGGGGGVGTNPGGHGKIVVDLS